MASHVRISKDRSYGPLIPAGHADIILTLEPVEALRLLSQLGNPQTVIITNSRPVYPPDVSSGRAKYPKLEDLFKALADFSGKSIVVDATEEALRLGDPIFTNIIMIGSLIGADVVPIDRETMAAILAERFKGAALESNYVALDAGIDLVKKAM